MGQHARLALRTRIVELEQQRDKAIETSRTVDQQKRTVQDDNARLVKRIEAVKAACRKAYECCSCFTCSAVRAADEAMTEEGNETTPTTLEQDAQRWRDAVEKGRGLQDEARTAIQQQKEKRAMEPQVTKVVYPCGCEASPYSSESPLPDYCPKHGHDPAMTEEGKS